MLSFSSLLQKLLRHMPVGAFVPLLDRGNSRKNNLNPDLEFYVRLSHLCPALSDLSESQARNNLGFLAGLFSGPKPKKNAQIENFTIDAQGLNVPVRLYTPTHTNDQSSLVVYFHGGGWVLGSLESHDNVCHSLAQETNHLVLAVDYPLAPEYPFPTAINAAKLCYQWALNFQSQSDRVNKGVFVAGDSAGGNIATVLCQICQQDALTMPSGQILIYPVTDLAHTSTTYDRYSSGYFLSKEDMDWFKQHYLSDLSWAGKSNASPLLHDDFTKFPPTLIFISPYDILAEEGRLYAQKLKESGVTVAVLEMQGMVHGFINLAGVSQSAHKAFCKLIDSTKAFIDRYIQ